MQGWKQFCSELLEKGSNLEQVKKTAKDNFERFGVYPDSIHGLSHQYYFIAKNDSKKVLVIYGQNEAISEFNGNVAEVGGYKVKVCTMDNENCETLRKYFPFTAPSNHQGKKITIGLGDRLGLASAGHLRLVKDKPVFPILAQQSIRELNLTGRNYRDVLSAASWAVFQEGYTCGFGADGDHLKTAEEVQMAMDCGFTMITLDCSEHIDNTAASMSSEQVKEKYSLISQDQMQALEDKYMEKEFFLKDGSRIFFAAQDFKRIVLVYLKAIHYTIDIYNQVIRKSGKTIDFEMSIDETLTSTTPESHFFVASELIAGGVEITSLAPRFYGEFQKGIDYRGDLHRFTSEFSTHVSIAKHFGYKISVHSGSDKFSVFPIVGEKTEGEYHLKTAGTNWLEAVRVIAQKKPSLYRKMHKFAIAHLEEAKKYYHISAKVENVPDIDKLDDAELPGLMNLEDSRQVLHITYGLILLAKEPDGSTVFKDEIYEVLNQYEEAYNSALVKHIGRHLSELGV